MPEKLSLLIFCTKVLTIGKAMLANLSIFAPSSEERFFLHFEGGGGRATVVLSL